MSKQLESRPYTAWQLIKAYWQSEQRLFAYTLFFAVMAISIFLVVIEVGLNYWYNYFYDALQEYDKKGVMDLLMIFLFIVSVLIIFAVYRYYLQQFLALRWRRWLTQQFLTRWLEKESYYYLENFDDKTDNPDQRIQEDINALVGYSLDLTVGLVSAIVTFFAFIYVLWQLSGSITIPLGQFGSLHIPGYLVWVTVIYAVIGTFFTIKIGRPLVSLNFEQQRREANFRFAAVDLRAHAEHVALYHGEHHQKNVLNRLFDQVLENWYMIILRQKLLLWFTAGYNQMAIIVPIMLALPNYFSHVFKLGGLMQTLRAFAQVQESLSFVVGSYTTIAQWQAVTKRLLTFLNHMYDVEHNAELKNNFSYKKDVVNQINLKNLNICMPSGDVLLKNINQEFIRGKDYLIKGPSGIGKSTLIRVIAGIWPYGSGEIHYSSDEKIMYLPQKTYMPLGTLKEALLFPDNILDVSDIKLIQLLKECGLPNLISRLDETAMWSQQLSLGEQQRIAFVRVLIHKPDRVFFDEVTSALDLESEKQLYQLLKAHLPNCSLVSVGHRPSLEAFHDYSIDLAGYSVRV